MEAPFYARTKTGGIDMKIYNLEESLRSVGKDIEKLSEETIAKAKSQIKVLASQTYGMVIEKASSMLKSRRKDYVAAVGLKKIHSSKNEEIWAVTLGRSADWIENGKEAKNMLQDFLKSPKAKVAKDGSRYLTIPFEHSKNPSEMSAAELRIANYVKSQLKQHRLDRTIKQNGKPVIGRAATIDLTGPRAPVSKEGKPLLQGLTIYQHEVKGKSGKTRIKRDVMTFRIASDKQVGKGLWDHPGLKGAKIFDQVEKEIDTIWSELVRGL